MILLNLVILKKKTGMCGKSGNSCKSSDNGEFGDYGDIGDSNQVILVNLAILVI